MKIEYKSWKPHRASLQVVDWCNEIITQYQAEGYDLTLRQLYYRLVAADLIPNTDKSYNRIGSIVNRARLAGMVDWEAIVDRTRQVRGANHFGSPADAVRTVRDIFRIDRWADQYRRVECWIEKDALVGVIAPVCHKLDIPYFSCRGYTSQSAQWRAAQRANRAASTEQSFDVIHLADHDPSGN